MNSVLIRVFSLLILQKVYPMVKWEIQDAGRHQNRLVQHELVMVVKSVILTSEYRGVHMESSWKQFQEAVPDHDKTNVTTMYLIMCTLNNADITATPMLDAMVV